MESDKNKQTPRVAILMATFNGMPFINEQVFSIKKQKGVDVDIFISDDGSNDGTLKLVKDNFRQDPLLTLLPVIIASGGAGQNFFRLIRDTPLADYQYFAFADQDDIWKADKLTRAINQLTTNNAHGYSSSVMAFWPNGLKKLIKKDYPLKKMDYFFEGPGPGCTFVMTRELFILLKEFVTINQESLTAVYYHDWFVYAFARTCKFKWVIDHQSHIDYRQHENNDTGANSGIAALISRVKKIWSYWARDQVYAIAELLGYERHIQSYFSSNLVSKLRLCRSFFQFRRSSKDCFALLILGLAGRFRPPHKVVEKSLTQKASI
jgi:rhamnosyltransferase